MNTATTAQADTDAETYQAYLENGVSKAATGRALGVKPATVAARIKRHLARVAEAAEAPETEDTAAEAEPQAPETTEEAETIEEAVKASEEAAGAGEAEGGEPEAEGDGAPVIRLVPRPAESPAKELATECEKCGFEFSKPQARKTCRSESACKKRQEARAAAAAAAGE